MYYVLYTQLTEQTHDTCNSMKPRTPEAVVAI